MGGRFIGAAAREEYRYDHPRREIPWAISVRDYRNFVAGTRTLSDLAAWNSTRVTVGHEEKSTVGMLVTCNFFRVYGPVSPVEGRLFNDDECSPRSVARVAIVSEEVVKSPCAAGIPTTSYVSNAARIAGTAGSATGSLRSDLG